MSIKYSITLTYDNLFQCRKYGLEDDTIGIIGHAIALQIDDSYLDQPAMDFVKRMKVQLIFL
jgi:RAB protein geranylgeranyltransferase component A